MKQTLYQRAFVTIILDTDIPAIYEEWHGSVSTSEFKTTLEKKLELYKELKGQHENLEWMVKLRGLKVAAQGQTWANEEFHPRLYPAGIKRIAVTIPEEAFHLLNDRQLSAHMDNKKQIELCYFDDFEDAVAWTKKAQLAL